MVVKIEVGAAVPWKDEDLELLGQCCHEAVAALGYFRTEAVAWLFEAMMDCMSHDYRKLLAQGEKMTLKDLYALDADTGLNMGWETWVALSPRGKDKPAHAAEATFRRIATRFYLRRRAAELCSLSPDDFLAKRWRHTVEAVELPCKQVRRYIGKTFSAPNVPILPLDKCGREFCTCFYRALKADGG